MTNPILVTGAAGRVGGSRTHGHRTAAEARQAVRAMVRNEDQRAQALRDMGAEVVVGDLLDLDSMHRAIAGCETMYFGMSVSDDLSGRDRQCGRGGKASRREGVHQHVADDRRAAYFPLHSAGGHNYTHCTSRWDQRIPCSSGRSIYIPGS